MRLRRRASDCEGVRDAGPVHDAATGVDQEICEAARIHRQPAHSRASVASTSSGDGRPSAIRIVVGTRNQRQGYEKRSRQRAEIKFRMIEDEIVSCPTGARQRGVHLGITSGVSASCTSDCRTRKCRRCSSRRNRMSCSDRSRCRRCMAVRPRRPSDTCQRWVP